MSESPDVKYYAAVGAGRTADNPAGLARRQFTPEGRLDEALQRDMSWKRTSGLIEWEHGELMLDYVEISAEKADELVERFRVKWAAGGGAPR